MICDYIRVCRVRFSKMSGELPCYTLINVPSDSEQPSEAQLKEKFEKGQLRDRGRGFFEKGEGISFSQETSPKLKPG